jgi:hypothetical protein
MSARRDKRHAGRGQVYVGNALVEHSVAVALSWCNAQVTNDVRAISLRRSKAADGLRLAASRRQAGEWNASGTTMAFKPTNVYANSADCGMRAAKHLRRARPILGVVGCHSSFELIIYVATSMMLSQCRGRHTFRCGRVLNGV